jgi:hypothetical protein
VRTPQNNLHWATICSPHPPRALECARAVSRIPYLTNTTLLLHHLLFRTVLSVAFGGALAFGSAAGRMKILAAL